MRNQTKNILRVFTVIFVFQLFFSIAFAKEFRYDSHNKRDPFSLASASGKIGKDANGATHLRLEGVVMDPKGKSLAVVNGEMVGEGDSIGGTILVKKITKDSVQFENNGQTVTIPIVNNKE